MSTTETLPAPPVGFVHDLPLDEWQKSCLELDPEILTEQMRTLAGQVAYWNSRFAEAQREFNRATRRRHELRARTRQNLRATMPKATIEALGDALEMDEAYITAQEQCFELEAVMLKAQAWAKAMDAKRSMLMSLGGFLRDELGEHRGG